MLTVVDASLGIYGSKSEKRVLVIVSYIIQFCVSGLGDMNKIKYHDISDQIPRYQYWNNIVEMAVDAFIKYLCYEVFDK